MTPLTADIADSQTARTEYSFLGSLLYGNFPRRVEFPQGRSSRRRYFLPQVIEGQRDLFSWKLFGMAVAQLTIGETFTTGGQWLIMKTRQQHIVKLLALMAMTPLFWLDTPASAQTVPTQSVPPAQNRNGPAQPVQPVQPAQNDVITRQGLASFNQFLVSHPEIAEQLRKDPSLVDNREFLERHPALQSYLQDHPAIREEIERDPNAFMRDEERFDRHEDRMCLTSAEMGVR